MNALPIVIAIAAWRTPASLDARAAGTSLRRTRPAPGGTNDPDMANDPEMPGTDPHLVHLARIKQIVRSWHRGDISVAEKREQIADENRAYYGREYRSRRTKELITSAH